MGTVTYDIISYLLFPPCRDRKLRLVGIDWHAELLAACPQLPIFPLSPRQSAEINSGAHWGKAVSKGRLLSWVPDARKCERPLHDPRQGS